MVSPLQRSALRIRDPRGDPAGRAAIITIVLLRALSVLAVAVILGAAAVGLLIWQSDRPPFDLAKLQQLQRGMSQQQVQQVLGEPQSSEAGVTSVDGTSWAYSRWMAWPTVYVDFDASGRLERYEY